MKNHLLSILAILFIVCSCDSALNEEYREQERESSKLLIPCTELQVTEKEINQYISNNPLTRSATPEIEPIIYEGDTLLYIINYGEGWEILSGDKRAPMVLAFSENGYLDLYNNSPGFYVWLNENAEAIYKLKKENRNIESPYTPEWEKALAQSILANVGGDNGYWEVIDIQNKEEITEYPRLSKQNGTNIPIGMVAYPIPKICLDVVWLAVWLLPVHKCYIIYIISWEFLKRCSLPACV